MTDIVERLRKAGLRDGFAVILYQHVQQAADEIERLREMLRVAVPREFHRGEIERLRADLDKLQKRANDTAYSTLIENR